MNPAFGRWPRDSDPAEGAEPDWGEVTEPESHFPLGWDLRNRAPRRPVPCRVTVGGWELEGVIFPVRRRTREQVKALAEEAVRTRGRLEGRCQEHRNLFLASARCRAEAPVLRALAPPASRFLRDRPPCGGSYVPSAGV